MLGNDGRRFVGIDSFDFRDGRVEQVEQNLAQFGLERPVLIAGDVFELVPEQLRAHRILTIHGKERGFPQWWEGMQVQRWGG